MYWVNMALLKKLKFNKHYHIQKKRTPICPMTEKITIEYKKTDE